MPDGRYISHKPAETLVRCAHADNDGHRLKAIILATFEEFLHDCCGTGSFSVMHPSVRLIDNHIEMVAFLLSCILQGLPDGIGTVVAAFHQIAGLAEFLRIQEINHPVIQHLLVKGVIFDCDALIWSDFVCLLDYFHLGLFIQLRRIGEPYEDSFRLFDSGFRAVKYVLNYGRHDNSLARACRRAERDHLRTPVDLVISHGAVYLRKQL